MPTATRRLLAWAAAGHRCRGVAALAALGAAVALSGAAPTTAATHPRCFGAASRDPLHHCYNPALRFEVTPTPSQALLIPSAPCTPIPASISACSFGASQSGAAATIALLGDSHADHWRAALWDVADALHWYGISVTHPSCPFTLAVLLASNPSRESCIQWNQGVIQWFAQNPDISTVFTSDHPAAVVRAPGQSEEDALVAGITAAWAKLPASVKHIIVIRDDPFIEQRTLPCVANAIAKHLDAGTACAFPRHPALHVDPDVVAAQRLRSPRVQVIDLSQFFCSSKLCYPVIGGVLVYKDYFDHLTDEYSTTLGPYLLRAVRTLMKRWS